MRARVFSAIALAAFAAASAFAQDAAEGEAAAPKNEELESELRYIEALVDEGYPDVAEALVERTKKRWPESEARLFAIEVRGLISLGRFEDAEKKVAALPDRKSTKYWAARLEMAQGFFARGQKDECSKIYEEFFKVFAKPPAEIRDFYLGACYSYGQLLALDRKYDKAAQRYASLFANLEKHSPDWCNIGCETVDLYLKLADQRKGPKEAKGREEALKAADKVVDQLLWLQDSEPLYFGRAVAMKAHVAEMRGDLSRAAGIIDDYRDQLVNIHEQILQFDPDGKKGVLRQSPLPECLFLQAKILWREAKEEYEKAKRDDEKVKSLMFGPKGKNGKRVVSKGAFAMAQNVFFVYESSSWAPQAGELAQEIGDFAKEKYNAKINSKITPEQLAKARARQFADANEKFVMQQYEEAIDAYLQALAKYPEIRESVDAVENVASCYLDLLYEEKDEAKKDAYRLDADAVEGYLAERFAGSRDRAVMVAAGDATIRLAAKEAERKSMARADRLYTAFFENYRRHPNAATILAGKAGECQRAGRYDDAIKYWKLLGACYTNSTFYASSLAQLSECCGETGDREGELAALKKYLDVETVKLLRLQAKFKLAQLYQKDGLADIAKAAEAASAALAAPAAPAAPAGDAAPAEGDAQSADGAAGPADTAAEVEKLEKRGTAQIVRAIQNFQGFSKDTAAALADPTTSKEDAEKYRELHEAAVFMVGVCWSRMTRPEKNLEIYRKKAAAGYEAYVKAYPDGKYAKACYVNLGTIYTALGEMAKSKEALDELSKRYPDSDEAKNAKPRLARNLIEMGLKKEGAEIYAGMLRTDGAYTAGQFVSAGEALVEGRSWDLAGQAFEKAIRLAGTNSPSTVARAQLGIARCAWKQGSLAEAREALDAFLSDPKKAKMAIAADANFMLVEVASDQGRVEKDATMRGKCFGAAIGALKKVRQYWAKKPQWEQDQLDLLSGDVLVDRMKAEEAMGLKEEALETCGRAASTFQVFIQAHGPTAERPLDKMEAGEVANLERAYASIVPLFSKMGAAQADRVVGFGGEYLELFPNGKAKTMVANCINQAKADLPTKGGDAEKGQRQ